MQRSLYQILGIHLYKVRAFIYLLDWHLLITVVKLMVDALNLAKVGQSPGFYRIKAFLRQKKTSTKMSKKIILFNCQIYELTCCLLSLRIQR